MFVINIFCMSENTNIGATIDTPRTEVVRSPKVVSRKGRHRMKRLKSLMEQADAQPWRRRNTTRNVDQFKPRAEIHN